jgi:hypothetical protein
MTNVINLDQRRKQATIARMADSARRVQPKGIYRASNGRPRCLRPSGTGSTSPRSSNSDSARVAREVPTRKHDFVQR